MSLFRLALEVQSLSPLLLSRKTGLTKGYVSRVIHGLSETQTLFKAVRFSYEALKLEVLIVLIEMDSLDVTLPQMLTRYNPWLYSLLDCKFGNRFALAHLIVPASWRSLTETKNWQSALRRMPGITEVRVFQRIERDCWRNYNFELYDGHGWRIPSGVYSPTIRELYHKDFGSLPVQVRSPDISRYVLDRDDVRIVSLLHENGPLTVRDLRTRMGRDYNYVRWKLQALKRRQIITLRIHPTSLFATGSLVLVSGIDKPEHDRLCRALSCLPEVYAERMSEGYSIMTMRLAEDQVPHVARDLNQILAGKNRWLLQYADHHFVNWRFPLNRWMDQHREWTIDEKDFGVAS